MRRDLKLLPQYTINTDFSQDVLSLFREEELFAIIKTVEQRSGRAVSKEIFTYLSPQGYGEAKETPYGNLLTGVRALELKKALKDYRSSSWRNRAFLNWLSAIPDDLEIWLYWC